MKQELFRKLVKEEIKTVLKEIKKSLKTPKLRENNKKEIRFDLVMSDEAYDDLFSLIARYTEDPDDVEKELDRYDDGGFDNMSNMVTANLDRDKDYIAWKKKYGIREGVINEELMPMDKRFVKDWEKSCKALLNHMANNYDDLTKTGDHMRLKNAYKWLVGAMKDIDKVSGYAAQMGKYFQLEVKEGVNEAPLDRKGKMIKGFQPGDMWREDFDYIGMLKWGADASAETMDLETLKAGYESFTDVNYHREAQDLGNAIDWMEDPGRDANRAQEMIESFLESFRKACAKTLKDITKK